jgi:hypothetical protein
MKWIEIRVRASPYAGCLDQLVAIDATRTAVRQNPRWVWHFIHWVKYFRFQGNFALGVFTITDLAGFPNNISH